MCSFTLDKSENSILACLFIHWRIIGYLDINAVPIVLLIHGLVIVTLLDYLDTYNLTTIVKY